MKLTSSQQAVATPAKRGFAAMSPETQRRIASEGGRASHESGRAHKWTSESARDAGRKGGQARASAASGTLR
ncbi:KGG domain-containing protein [uncultured Hymenobacter sp.]|uniref:KGG domain-containing protein n=1 Tax=uncultured Hymenobacter sp. TaxID=170016 RepID=UPI0035CBF3CC